MPYVLAISILYKNHQRCLRIYYISCNIIQLSLPLSMTLHLHRGRWWPIICPSIGALINVQKGFHHQSSTYPDSVINYILSGTTGYTWFDQLLNSTRVYLVIFPISEVLTQQRYVSYSECGTLPHGQRYTCLPICCLIG